MGGWGGGGGGRTGGALCPQRPRVLRGLGVEGCAAALLPADARLPRAALHPELRLGGVVHAVVVRRAAGARHVHAGRTEQPEPEPEPEPEELEPEPEPEREPEPEPEPEPAGKKNASTPLASLGRLDATGLFRF